MKELGKYLGVECIVSTGGTSFKEDVYRLNKTVHCVVGNKSNVYLNLIYKYIFISNSWKNPRFNVEKIS